MTRDHIKSFSKIQIYYINIFFSIKIVHDMYICETRVAAEEGVTFLNPNCVVGIWLQR